MMLALRDPWLREPWRTRVLWLSVAVNLFAAALAGARYVTGPSHPPGLAGAAERMARDLPPADAARFRAVMDHERPWFDSARHSVVDARDDLARSIAQTPYDASAVHERMDVLQARMAKTSGQFSATLLKAIGVLSPEGRAKLAETAKNSGPR